MSEHEMREGENYFASTVDNWAVNIQEVNGQKILSLALMRHTVKFCVNEHGHPIPQTKIVPETLATFSMDEALAREMANGINHYLDNYKP
ncbi:hypothetical protein WH292_08515 [Enterobacter sp. MYb186]